MNARRSGAGVIFALMLIFAAGITNDACAQDCPQPSATGPNVASQAQTLEGQLVYHNGIRHWFELQLDAPQCGESSLQLMQIGAEDFSALAVLRGCRVRSTGTIDFSPTGYYSRNLFQDVKKIEPVGACAKQPPFPPEPDAKPDKQVQAYKVTMHVVYGDENQPIVFDVRSDGRELQPWQAYASYWLTGDLALYGKCAEGFAVGDVSGTPEADPGHFWPGEEVDMATFEPEAAAQRGNSVLDLSYTCIRR